MRSRRLSFVAGWAAVALTAIAGFAAFGSPESTPDEVQAEAAAASIGHTAGAYAGLSFSLLGSDTSQSPSEPGDADFDILSPLSADSEVSSESTQSESVGTITSPSSGWMSEVEVRTLVSIYFEPTDVNRAVRIAWCESRFDPNATDLRTGGVGLFNHLPRYWIERAASAGFAGADPTDPEASTAAAAWEVYNGAGWEIFNCG